MTKCIAVGDIHLNLRKNKQWETSRFLDLFTWLSKQDAEVIFILGDTFDVNKPSLDEISLFYEGISLLYNKKVYLIDGNHEAITSDISVFDKLPQVGFTYIKNDIIKIEGIRIYLVSWTRLRALPKLIKGGLSSLPKCLMTHIRCTVPPHIKEELPLAPIVKAFNTVVAGDIHMTGYKPFDNMYYTGQPYSTHYKVKGLHTVLGLTFDRRGLKVEQLYTTFPNKVLITTTANDVPKLNNTDLFKVRVSGTITELEELKDKGNIIYDKVLSDINTKTLDDDDIRAGKINISDTILKVMSNMDISDGSMLYGKELMEEVQ